ncbi:FAD/NAD(P)-binding domain-containing protein [Phlegmacium glaucopus]|nr:FAD/NAD(P)-binding domain-containing protein [Phlegmacium glaucopus]
MFNMVDRPSVVIVGGGGAGVQIARLLSMELDRNKYNLILVTPRPYYTHLPAWIRMSVTSEGALEDRAHITYNYNFVNGNGQFVIAKVVSITTETGDKEGFLTLDTGETLNYSVLILTPGSIWEGPLNIPDNKAATIDHLRNWRETFEESNDILLVGGGAVALEYAGEIRDRWSDKRITIVQGDELLLNEAYPNSFRKSVARSIRKRDVTIILNDRVDDLEISDAGTITTRNGRKLVADLVIPCQGPRPNAGFVTLDAGTFSETGHVRVSSTFQVFGYPRIFAGGDVIEWDEQKQVSKYSTHASIITRNVISVLEKKQPAALYEGSYEMISIANGKQGGSSYWSIFWGPSFGDWVSSHLKSKDLFLTWTRKNMGLQS